MFTRGPGPLLCYREWFQPDFRAASQTSASSWPLFLMYLQSALWVTASILCVKGCFMVLLAMRNVFQTTAGLKAIKLPSNNTHYLSQPQFLEHMCIPAVRYIHRKIVSWWFRTFACDNLPHHVMDKSAHVLVNGRDGGPQQGWIDSHESQSQQKLEGGNNISYFYCHLKNKHFFSDFSRVISL